MNDADVLLQLYTDYADKRVAFVSRVTDLRRYVGVVDALVVPPALIFPAEELMKGGSLVQLFVLHSLVWVPVKGVDM